MASLKQSIIGFVCGVAVSLCVWYVSKEPPSAPMVASEDQLRLAAGLQEVLSSLRGVASQLRDAGARFDGASPHVTAVPEEERLPIDNHTALDELNKAVGELLALLKARPATAGTAMNVTQLIAERGPARWDELDKTVDPKVRQKLVMMTSEDILRCFGAPTTWDSEGGHVRWIYRSDVTKAVVVIAFKDGFVTDVQSTGPQ